MNCPSCRSQVPNENINIAANIAQCEACDLVFKISDTVAPTKSSLSSSQDIDLSFDINNPPKGVWIRNKSGQLIIHSTTRSAIAFFLVPFMLVWSGGSLGGIYGPQILSGEFNLFLSLFGIPFLLGSVLFWGIALMSIWGKVVITLDNNDGRIFTGIGKIGYTKRFALDKIKTVREEETRGNKGATQRTILLEGQERVSFGSNLSDSRRYYVLKTLQLIVDNKSKNKSFLNIDLSNHLIG